MKNDSLVMCLTKKGHPHFILYLPLSCCYLITHTECCHTLASRANLLLLLVGFMHIIFKAKMKNSLAKCTRNLAKEVLNLNISSMFFFPKCIPKFALFIFAFELILESKNCSLLSRQWRMELVFPLFYDFLSTPCIIAG